MDAYSDVSNGSTISVVRFQFKFIYLASLKAWSVSPTYHASNYKNLITFRVLSEKEKTSVSMSFNYFYILVEFITSSFCSQDCTHVGCSQATGEVERVQKHVMIFVVTGVLFLLWNCYGIKIQRRRLHLYEGGYVCAPENWCTHTANSMVETAWPSGGTLDL